MLSELVGREVYDLPIGKHEVHLLDAFSTPGLNRTRRGKEFQVTTVQRLLPVATT
jgi:hypothetical protein